MNLALQLPAADAQQWLRLRQLRVQRARQSLAAAQAAEREAQQAVQARQQRIEAGQAQLDALTRHWAGAGCAGMPRWAAQVDAHRAALAERLERNEYALIDEAETLRQAQATVQQRRADLARAQAREDAVDATLQDRRRHLARSREQQAELDAEDARRLPLGGAACRA